MIFLLMILKLSRLLLERKKSLRNTAQIKWKNVCIKKKSVWVKYRMTALGPSPKAFSFVKALMPSLSYIGWVSCRHWSSKILVILRVIPPSHQKGWFLAVMSPLCYLPRMALVNLPSYMPVKQLIWKDTCPMGLLDLHEIQFMCVLHFSILQTEIVGICS